MAPPKLHGNGAKAEALKHWIMLATSGMGTSSPAEVLTNFIRILEGASPRLRLLIALSTPWAMLLAAVAGYARVWSTINTAKSYLADSLYSSITIPDTHPMNKQVLSYVAEQGLGNNARALALSMSQVDAKQLSATMQAHYDDIYGYGRGPRGPQKHRHAESDEDDKPVLAYVPDVGTYSFWFKYHRFTLVRQPNLRQEMDIKGKMQWIHTSSAAIKISCFSLFGGAGPIKDFLKYVQDIPTKERTTTIFRPQQNGSTWDAGITRPSRNLNAVTLDTKIKDGLVKDIETYLTPETKRYYANRGIPWRRGFLFYGHPGCGKTSFTNTLAGHFNLNVYMLSLSTTALTDVILESLFEQLPNKCIVLLEDIDSAGISRENMKEKARAKTKRNQRPVAWDDEGQPIYELPRPGGVTLSGLLNVLDGIHSREGMITIMTSNTPDSLDPALVRPGRIDRKVLFGHASVEVTSKLFSHIFEKAPEEVLAEDVKRSVKPEIAMLARQFSKVVPADKLTPAEVQGYLLVHREDPVAAVMEAKEWALKLLETKKKGANVAAFSGSDAKVPAGRERGTSGTARRKDSGWAVGIAPDEVESELSDAEEEVDVSSVSDLGSDNADLREENSRRSHARAVLRSEGFDPQEARRIVEKTDSSVFWQPIATLKAPLDILAAAKKERGDAAPQSSTAQWTIPGTGQPTPPWSRSGSAANILGDLQGSDGSAGQGGASDSAEEKGKGEEET